MTARLTLASRGFVLPKNIPTVGRKDLDCIAGWHTMALRLVIRDFLEPDLRGTAIQGVNSILANDVINRAAAADGFDWMTREIHRANCDPIARETVAEWLGIPVEQIWPHHARTTTKSLHAQRDTPAAEPTPATDVEANTTLMAPTYSADGAACNPFVHAFSKRAIPAQRSRIRDAAPLFMPIAALIRVTSATTGALGYVANALNDWIEPRVERLDDSSCLSRRQLWLRGTGRWLISPRDQRRAATAFDDPADWLDPAVPNARDASQASGQETTRPAQGRAVPRSPKDDLHRLSSASRAAEALQRIEDREARQQSRGPLARKDEVPSSTFPGESTDDSNRQQASKRRARNIVAFATLALAALIAARHRGGAR